jgi:hypothetical protein
MRKSGRILGACLSWALALQACSGSEPSGNDDDYFIIAPDAVNVEVDSVTRVELTNWEPPVVWTSDDPSVATVEGAEFERYASIQGVREGTTTVRVASSDGQHHGSAAVRVLGHLEVDPVRADLGIGQSVQLTVRNAAGPVTYAADPTPVGTLSPSGLVTALRPGAFNVTVRDGLREVYAGISVWCEVEHQIPWVYDDAEITFLAVPPGFPEPETLDTSFYAVRGAGSVLSIYFKDGAGGRGAEYFRLTFQPGFEGGPFLYPDGTEIPRGDSALIRVRIPDPHVVRFELTPSGMGVGLDAAAMVRINAAGMNYPVEPPADGSAYDLCLFGSLGGWIGDPGMQLNLPQFYGGFDAATGVLSEGIENGILRSVGIGYHVPEL